MRRVFSLILFLVLAHAFSGYAAVYHVSVNGNDITGNGTSGAPWKTITKALASITGTAQNPHTIFVAAGIYSQSTTGETFPLKLKSYILVLGAGDSLTILDAQNSSRVFTVDSVAYSGIAGVTIKNGKAPVVSGNRNYGGGIYIANSHHVAVRGTSILNNTATNVMGGLTAGGGIYVSNCEYVLITQNKIRKNSAMSDGTEGGGIYFSGAASIISQNLIDSNSTSGLFGGPGGGLYCMGSPLLIRNYISNNSGGISGGGIYLLGSALVARNNIYNNTFNGISSGQGGGIYIYKTASPFIGGSFGNGNNIFQNAAGTGKSLFTLSPTPIEARYNYLGQGFPADTTLVSGNFIVRPFFSNPAGFDTSSLIAVPSPLVFDTTRTGAVRSAAVSVFNALNSLADTVSVLGAVTHSAAFQVNDTTAKILPAGNLVLRVTFAPADTGRFIDSITVRTNIRTIHTPLIGFAKAGPVAACYDLRLMRSWNIVSLPVYPANALAASLFPNANSPAYAYNNGYVTADTLKMTRGYWLRFPDTATVRICGAQVNRDTLLVAQGWNLLGVFGRKIPAQAVTSIPPNIINSVFYQFNGAYAQADTLFPGKGYWVRTTSSGALALPAQTAGGAVLKIPAPAAENVIALRITDGNGSIGRLFLAKNDGADNASFDLPPLPPPGIFDVRFTSGRFRENISAGGNDFAVSSAEYPLTITAGGGGVVIRDKVNGTMLNKSLADGESITVGDDNLRVFSVEARDVPGNFRLEQNYPNPFNPVTSIQYAVGRKEYGVGNGKAPMGSGLGTIGNRPRSDRGEIGISQQALVSLRVYDVLGREVATLVNEEQAAGNYEVKFDAVALPSGTYFYELREGEFRAVKKMILLR